MTWIIATIIIIVILIFSIFVASFIGKGGDKGFFPVYSGRDLLVAKSLSGFLLTKSDSGEKIFDQIKIDGDLNNVSVFLSLKIFKALYSTDYSDIRLDIRGTQATPQSPILQEYYGTVHSFTVNEKIYLHKDKDEYLGVFLSYRIK